MYLCTPYLWYKIQEFNSIHIQNNGAPEMLQEEATVTSKLLKLETENHVLSFQLPP